MGTLREPVRCCSGQRDIQLQDIRSPPTQVHNNLPALQPPNHRIRSRQDTDKRVQHHTERSLTRQVLFSPSENRRRDHRMSITYDYIDDYLYRIAQPRDPLLERMEEYADTNNVPIIE